jgi:hypothetical protein
MIRASKDFSCPFGENFPQKKKRKISIISTKRGKKNLHKFLKFLVWKKQQNLSQKMNDVIVCVLSMNGG